MTSEQNENPSQGNEANDDNLQPTTPDQPTEPVVETPGDPDPGADEDQSSEFAAMLAAEEDRQPGEPIAGTKVTGTIIQIGDVDAFVDCGLRTELPMALSELRDDEGNLQFEVGQQITAHIQKVQDSFKLTMAINLRDAGLKALQEAFSSGTPVEGKVQDTNKGGFSIDLGGKRGFCPFSQIDLRRIDDPAQFVGKKLQFKILELSEDGRNIVLSRRALLDADRQAQGSETRASLNLGDTRDGVITRLVPFGAFVDIGGVEGLVHISQISHQRVGNPADVLQEGQNIQVKVMEIQNLGQGRSERISLSIKALAEDPWPASAGSLTPGTDVQGKVTRLVDFGVFVELLPGIEGLIHISELANRRIIHPREVLNEGEDITVRIVDVDLSRRRISLSRRQASDYDED